MDEEKTGVLGIESAGECNSIPELGESTVFVGGGREETSSLEDKPVTVGGGAEDGQENHEAVSEPEFVDEEMVEMPAVYGGSEMIASEGVERVDYVEREAVVSEGEKATVSDVSRVNKEGDELVIDCELEKRTGEEIASVVEAKLETDVTDSEMQMDAKRDELNVDPEMKSETEFRPLVDPKMEVVDTDAGRLSEFPTDEAMDGTQTRSDKHDESELGDEVENVSVEILRAGNNAEPAERCEEITDEKGDSTINDGDGRGENLTIVEEEKGDSGIVADLPRNEVETDGSVHLVNVCEQEQVHESRNGMEDVSGHERNEHEEEKVLVQEESQIHENRTVDDGKLNRYASSDAKLDEQLSEAEHKEDVLVKGAELPKGDIKPEEESRGESEDAEVETEMGTNSIDSKTPDDDGKLETEDTMSDVDEPGHDMYDSPGALQEEDDEMIVAEEETGAQDTEMETETDMAESGKTSGGKRKRAKLSKSPSITKATGKPSKKMVGEDVCFICFDGGELVLCDRRGCPKAYHPSCVNRDEAFFKSKGRWNCGWHLCSICEKNARYMCYTCTFSLCRSCTKDAVILCVRGNKGFCETCMRTVKLIENNEQGDTEAQIDFDDRSGWEYLFKDYYIDLKDKLSLSLVEIAEAKNPWKGADISGTSKTESPELQADANYKDSGSDDSIENSDAIRPKRRKTRKQSKSQSKKQEPVDSGDRAVSLYDNSEWASRELLEFVSHMKNGDTSVLSQFDVQALLLDYIKRNKLRDSHRKSQIVCDARLQNIFGKPRVGHFEMLKLLESHFLTRDEQTDDFQGSVVDTENDQFDNDVSPETLTKGVKYKKRKSRKKGDGGPQSNLDDFAAIDMHNIGLIYLRRKLVEDLLEDTETFNEKVIGTFVRIRISGNNLKQDLYRLVQVVGTSKATEPYKIGKKTTETMVEILNLDKTEIISIDTISNQEFTEDECKRLRQSIKCGLISRLNVGEILDKTMEIQVVRVNDWLEAETQRLSHLRDRASDLGRRKELRECVEKLQLLKTPEERRRRMEEIPEIHADPKMDPGYESDGNDSENEEARREPFMRSRGSGFSKRGRGPISPGRDNYVKESWNSAGKSTPSRSLSGNNHSANSGHVGEILNESSWNLERDRSTQESNYLDKLNSATKSEPTEWPLRTASRPESTSGVVPQGSYSAGVADPAVKINKSEKMWHYQDPAGKVQGPFSMVQLRKWNNTGYFPANLKIWRTAQKQENSILLVDALAGNFPKGFFTESPVPATNTLNSSHTLTGQSVKISGDNERSNANQRLDLSADKWSVNETTNLPSPTPKQTIAGWSGGEGSRLAGSVQSPSVNGVLPSPTAVLPNIATHSPNPASVHSVVPNSNLSPTLNSQRGILASSAVPLHAQTASTTEPLVAQMHARPPAAVQPVITQNLPADAQVWDSSSQSGQAQGYGLAPSNVQSSSGSFPNPGTGAGIQPDVWRPTQISQPNMHSPTTPNASWSMGPPENMTPMVVRPQNPNVGWGTMQANPNMGWGNANPNWGPAMQVPPASGNTPGWVPPPGNTGGNMPVMGPGNANPGWGPTQGWGAPPSQVPAHGNGWGSPSRNVGAQGNGNQGWGPWIGDQSRGGGQFSGQRGRESGFGGGGRPWNRQSSFGGSGGGGGPRLNKSETPCPFNANGRCIKGSRCDYLHK